MRSKILLCIDEVLLDVCDGNLLFLRCEVDDLVREVPVLVCKEEVGAGVCIGEDSDSGWVLDEKVCIREVKAGLHLIIGNSVGSGCFESVIGEVGKNDHHCLPRVANVLDSCSASICLGVEKSTLQQVEDYCSIGDDSVFVVECLEGSMKVVFGNIRADIRLDGCSEGSVEKLLAVFEASFR